MDDSTSDAVTWDRTEEIGVPSSNGVFVLRIMDWCRIRRDLEKVAQPIPWLQRVYSLFFGVFISTSLSTIGVYLSEGLPSWALPLYACLSIFSLLLSIVTFYLEKTSNKTQQSDINRIQIDMKAIENTIPKLKKYIDELPVRAPS